MKLPEVRSETRQYTPEQYSPALRVAVEDAIVDDLKIGTSQRRGTMRVQVTVMWLFVVFAVVTFVVAIGGALGLWPVDEKAFAPIWTTFGVSFGTLAGGHLLRARRGG